MMFALSKATDARSSGREDQVRLRSSSSSSHDSSGMFEKVTNARAILFGRLHLQGADHLKRHGKKSYCVLLSSDAPGIQLISGTLEEDCSLSELHCYF